MILKISATTIIIIFVTLFVVVICNFKKILKTYPPKLIILNVDFALKLSNYRSLKRFICLK